MSNVQSQGQSANPPSVQMPNEGMQATAYSVRFASAFSRG